MIRNILRERFHAIWARFRGSGMPQSFANAELPLRSELLSADKMQEHGEILAASHELKSGRYYYPLLARLADNQKLLLEVHNLLVEDVKAEQQITPVGEWLLDNFYVIDEQIRTASRHLPKGYSVELPRLAKGASAGLPRVYDIALETISHSDGRVDPENLGSFVAAYQSVAPLKLGELWAIPIMLRLALIENLRRIASRIAADRIERNRAEYWADQLTKVAAKDSQYLILAIADMVRSNPPLVSSFVAELTRRLSGRGLALALPLTWIEQRLSESGLTIKQLVRSENQQQAADQVSISNSIGSLRLLGSMDWREFVESISVVEQTLYRDPADIYGMMDFASRDRYRHVVEKIAKSSRFSENEVAGQAIQLAQAAAERNGGDSRAAHVGYYLIDGGLAELEKVAEMHRSPMASLCKACRRFPLLTYVGPILLLSAVFTGCLVAQGYADGVQGWKLWLFGLLLLVCTSRLAVSLMNWLATLLASPCLLPRLDFSKGIPQEFRTLVVVPTMLTSTQGIEDLVKALEVRFLANRKDHLHFCLLTDCCDAREQTLPEDEPLVQLASLRIAELNEKYPGSEGDSFFLFHRHRRWNPQDRIWMGYERKRGKLALLNGFLRGGPVDGFALVTGNTAVLSRVKYVITLDTDTQLGRDTAWQFIGTMAHPLNQASYDKGLQRVVGGYGILQPRVAASLSGANRSRYARLIGSDLGIDPYTRAVSDVYQDLFSEGSFIGKGIYDVNAFELAVNGRFPENRILSHDLLEGCYARSGLLSDVQLYEEYPPSYAVDVSRQRRWIRGDWQIAQWIFSQVPWPDKGLVKNPLTLFSRWKIFDNLRRSLTPAALTLLLLLGWAVLPSALFWTLAVIGIMFLHSVFATIQTALQKPVKVTLKQHLRATIHAARKQLEQGVFSLVCLPYEAFFSTVAIMRAIWRMHVTHRLLLQWNSSDAANRTHRNGLAAAFQAMWIGPCLAAGIAVVLTAYNPSALVVATPILALWFVSPIVAWWISRPAVRRRQQLTPDQTRFLRKLARKTWAFFETFITEEDNWLPPDNFQEAPVGIVAHRTSPTNMGLALMANLSAYDFGTISTGQLIERTSKALHTMAGLERYQGHFYNWYDTQSLKPLLPHYVSSVDSGNLAAHLLTLRSGLLEIGDHKILSPRFYESLIDTIGIVIEAAADAPPPAQAQLLLLQQTLESRQDCQPTSLQATRQRLDQLVISSAAVVTTLEAHNPDPTNPLLWWAQALSRQCQNALAELTHLTPWTDPLCLRNGLEGFPELDGIPTLQGLAELELKLQPKIQERLSSADTPNENAHIKELQRCIRVASKNAQHRLEAIHELGRQCEAFSRMDYDFLYDDQRQLFSIGYNVTEYQRDSGYYDLLASEARLATFVAIAQGRVPQESWFSLGRLLTSAGGDPILLSWSGSMFEYLMPLLVMPTFENTLLDQTYRAAVARQIKYGKERGVPWGISEGGYNTIDSQLNYQYRAFGVPGLGLKRGLADDLVVAPYATALALMVAPFKACLNLERLSAEGLETRYGYYEAVDYTPSRLPLGKSSSVIRSFMAHHQGMSYVAFAHVLLDRPMQRRFESDPLFQSTMLLLQERIPKATAFYKLTSEFSEHRLVSSTPETPLRVFKSPDTPNPEVQLLSNGRYHVLVTNSGGGYSRWKDLAVTRWREDHTCDNWGMFVYLRDVNSGEVWSTAHQPTLKPSKHYEAIFSQGRAEFRRRDHDYETHTEIAVSPEDDIELRRVRISNRARVRRTIDVTSYAEVVLAQPAADALHPAFSNLFVQTETNNRLRTVLCTRRPRSQSEQTPWMLHQMTVHGAETGEVSFETDRMQFIGRGHTIANPQAVTGEVGSYSAALSGSAGSVLDPVVAIRQRITLDPGESATIDIVSGIGESRDAALLLAEKYQDLRLADRVFDLAWTHDQVLLHQINASVTDGQLYRRLASSIVYTNSSLRADTSVLTRNRQGQSGLWGKSISGDLPIVLLKIENQANIELVRQLVQAHTYWRLKGLIVDLVILNEDHGGYRQLLHDQIMALIAAGTEANVTDQPGSIFVIPAELTSEEDHVLIETVARIIISDNKGSLVEQISGRSQPGKAMPILAPSRTRRPEPPAVAATPLDGLMFSNGLGGFTPDGREYVIATSQDQLTPAPWVNVLANPHFGTVISESGLAHTWSENAHEFRLTPWANDPVCDLGGEAFYIRDEERGHFWSPTPLPCRMATPYVTRHGFGYSIFEHTERGIRSELCVYVSMNAAVKFSVLKVCNVSGRSRRISATGYAEWVLGDLRPKTAMHVVTEVDPVSGALFARNPYNTEFPDRTAFFDVDDQARTISGDRTEFLGRNGTLRAPAAMARTGLSGKVGAGLDPCAAIQVSFDLAPGQEREVVFRLGIGQDAVEARNLVQRFKGPMAARIAHHTVLQHWKHTLGAVHVETPDQSLNVLANGWLMYQVLVCRLWARCATYQSGGAFGFRDQLQDVMALVHAEPQLVREHLLRCAAHQFLEGDVQHWWHPPKDRGVRTHCSDDYLWLPFTVCRYVKSTGDTGVLDERIHFIQGRPVNADEDSYYDKPVYSSEQGSLYDHCVRAIRHGFRSGVHGLPLIGSGDWNDGMDLVGEHGKGESVWLGFFLYDVLLQFTEIAKTYGDQPFVEECEAKAAELRSSIKQHGWDGEWYRRAYFDDGSPLGSSVNAECQIDSITQSWSVLSGAGEPERSRLAMQAVDERLVRREHRLVQLLDPPFDKSDLNPGYIKGYVPGVRENGGQYTHAAIWATMAFAQLGDSRRAWELFQMINPVNHARSPEEVAIYKVEPYVAAADVYAVSPHTGRGGWTWYTGSAAWMYRLIVESLLGLRLEVDKLHFEPCLPAEWDGFKLHYRYRETVYHINVLQLPAGNFAKHVSLDGVKQEAGFIPLVDDHGEHWVEVRVPATSV